MMCDVIRVSERFTSLYEGGLIMVISVHHRVQSSENLYMIYIQVQSGPKKHSTYICIYFSRTVMAHSYSQSYGVRGMVMQLKDKYNMLIKDIQTLPYHDKLKAILDDCYDAQRSLMFPYSLTVDDCDLYIRYAIATSITITQVRHRIMFDLKQSVR